MNANDELVSACRIAGHEAVQKLLAEYDADHDRPVSQRECDEAFARAIIPLVLEHAAKKVEGRIPVVQCMSVEPVVTALSEAAAAIRALGGE